MKIRPIHLSAVALISIGTFWAGYFVDASEGLTFAFLAIAVVAFIILFFFALIDNEF